MSFFVNPVVNEWGEMTYMPTTAGLTVLIFLIIAAILLGVRVFGKNKQFSAKQLAFTALAIALATVTSFIKIIHMPMGGSVTFFSMLFITLVGYWYGSGSGLTAAFAYGILQMVIDPYILSVPQMLIDYIFAFTALGLSGVFTDSKTDWSVMLRSSDYVFAVFQAGCFGLRKRLVSPVRLFILWCITLQYRLKDLRSLSCSFLL